MWRFVTFLMLVVTGVACAPQEQHSGVLDEGSQSSNLIQCKVMDMYDCEFSKPYVEQATYPHEMEFSIEYTYSCGPQSYPQDYFVGFLSETDGRFQPVTRYGRGEGQSVIAKVNGQGPVRFHDSDTEWTRNNPKFEKDCFISVGRIVGRDISPAVIGEIQRILGSVLPVQETRYLSAKSTMVLITALETAISKLDLTTLKTLFSSLRSNLGTLVVGSDLSALENEIDLITTLNPAVDRQEKIDEVVDALLPQIKNLAHGQLKSLSQELSQTFADLDSRLLYADPASLISEREVILTSKKRVGAL
jgi:hypothetical protein